jgi:hypothetical protein
MLSSALVLLAALILLRGNRRAARLTAAGMACGFVGDLVMARVIPLPQHVIGGIAAFGSGHLLYLGALHDQRRRLGLATARNTALGLGAGWLVAGAGWRLLAYNPAGARLLNAAALAYALLLGSFAGLSGASAAQHPGLTPLALGSALFLCSDLILAGELFRDLAFPQIGEAIWLTYLGGQILIVDSLTGGQESPLVVR